MCLSIMMVMYNKQHLSNYEAEFTKKLSHAEAELKKGVALKKACTLIIIC